MKILIAGETGNHCLEMSYYEAFRFLGHDVKLFDTKGAIESFSKPPYWGFHLHRFFPVEAWIRKANKQFAECVREFQPDVIIAFTGAELSAGTIAYCRTICNAKIVWYWADPLPNLSKYIHDSLSRTNIKRVHARIIVNSSYQFVQIDKIEIKRTIIEKRIGLFRFETIF